MGGLLQGMSHVLTRGRTWLDGDLDRRKLGYCGQVPRAPTAWSGVTPLVDVAKTAEDIVISAEIPGLDEKDLEVTLSG
jgi:HSP20 family molecular chaperone IbpA